MKSKSEYTVVLRKDRIELWALKIRLTTIHAPEIGIDTEFYEQQGWRIIHGIRHQGPADKGESITIRNKEEINNALVQAEINHRLTRWS